MKKNPENEVIGLTLPLPCAVKADTASGLCGNPAWVGYAWRQGGGLWTVQPICQSCTQAMMRLYGVDQVRMG